MSGHSKTRSGLNMSPPVIEFIFVPANELYPATLGILSGYSSSNFQILVPIFIGGRDDDFSTVELPRRFANRGDLIQPHDLAGQPRASHRLYDRNLSGFNLVRDPARRNCVDADGLSVSGIGTAIAAHLMRRLPPVTGRNRWRRSDAVPRQI
jgi:hypothetical protein